MMKKFIVISLLALGGLPLIGNAADYIWCQSEPHDSGKRYYSNVFAGDHQDKLTYQIAFENHLKARYVDGDELLTSFCFSEPTGSEAKSKRDADAAYARSNIFNYQVIFLDWKY